MAKVKIEWDDGRTETVEVDDAEAYIAGLDLPGELPANRQPRLVSARIVDETARADYEEQFRQSSRPRPRGLGLPGV